MGAGVDEGRARAGSVIEDEGGAPRWEAPSIDGRVPLRVRASGELWATFQAAYLALGVEFGVAFDEALGAWVEARCAERPELAEAVRQARGPQPGPLAGPGEG